MKRIFALVLAILALSLMIVSCGEKNDTQTAPVSTAKITDCELCGNENVECEKITYEGETGWFCGECYDVVIELLEYAETLE